MRKSWKVMGLAASFAVATSVGIAVAGDNHKHAKGDKSTHAAAAKIGQPAPAFSLTGYDGKTYELSNYKDKIVVLEWFNKDCPVCQKYMPTMKETAEKYAKKGVIWLAIDSTNSRTAKQNADVAKEEKIPYPILSDFDGKTGHSYGATSTPHMFVINKGTLAYAGAIDDSKGHGEAKKNYVSDALDSVLAGKPVATAETKSFGCSVKYKK